MQQITDGILNITVNNPNVPVGPDGPGGDSFLDGFNLAVPNTGFGDFINALGPTGCTIVTLAIVSFLVTLIFFCLRHRLRHIRFLSVFEIGLVAFTIGFAIPAIVSTVNATNVSTVNLNVTTKEGETTTATATTDINIGPVSRGYMIYAYIENSNALVNTTNPGSTIRPTTPTSSTDPSALSTNTYGIRTDTTGGFTSLSTDPKHPTLLYSADTATTSGVLTITYGVKADSNLTGGTYTNADTANKIKYIVEPQHAFTLSYATATPASHMPTSTTYGPAAVLSHIFTIPSDTDNIPTRTDGYAFSGWCRGNVTTQGTTDTCDGDVYHPGDNITLDIDSATATNPDISTTLNAMWQKVTLKYDANGGTGAPASQTIPTGGSIPYTFTIPNTPADIPTKVGHTFQHWNTKADGTGTSYNPGDNISISAETTLYAIWKADVHRINYKSYDGTTTYGFQDFTYGTPTNMRSYNDASGWDIKPTAPAGKTFVGWTRTQGNTTPDYTDEQSINNLTADITLYAIWKQDLTLNFHQGNGTNSKVEKTIYNGDTSTTYDAPTVLDRSSETPIQTTVGWGNSDTATTATINSGATGQTISKDNNNTNYYAAYSYPVAVHYQANTGSGSMFDSTCTAHSTAKQGVSGYNLTNCTINLSTNTFTKTGYTFQHWNTKADDTGTSYNAGAPFNLIADQDFYAIWQVNQHSITYDLDGGTAGTSQPTTATYNADIQITNPTKTGYAFKGWTITGMDSTTHYYGNNTSSYTTTTATSLTGIKATYFKNLRATSGTVTFKAVWALTFDGAFASAGKTKSGNYYKMQDMTSSICSAVASPTSTTSHDEQTTTLIDTRDSKTYLVSKLADGKCWMTQNLDLDITTTGLTNTDTDLNSQTAWNSKSTYPPKKTETTSSTSSSYTDAKSWSLGNYYYDGTTSTSCGNTANSYADCVGKGVKTTGDKHYYVGNLYSYNAATAGTGGTITNAQAKDSICPKGWKLPTSNTSGNFQTLLNKYGITSGTGTTGTVQKLIDAPLYMVRGGYANIADGVLDQVAYSGQYWSSTASSEAEKAYYLVYYNTTINPSNNSNRKSGRHVRCIAR